MTPAAPPPVLAARTGDQLAVSAELVDVSDNRQLWGGRYNREQADVLAIEEDLATTIAATLKVERSRSIHQAYPLSA